MIHLSPRTALLVAVLAALLATGPDAHAANGGGLGAQSAQLRRRREAQGTAAPAPTLSRRTLPSVSELARVAGGLALPPLKGAVQQRIQPRGGGGG